MLILTENTMYDKTKFDQFLWEVVSLPDSLQKLIHRKSVRQKMFEELGKKAFLDPDKLKFPVMNPKTGEYDCRMLYAARVRALQYAGRKPGYREFANKAKELYQKQGCTKKLDVKLEESDEVIDLVELLEMLLILEGE